MKSPVLISITRITAAFVVGFVLNLPFTPVALDFLGVSTDQAAGYVGGAVTGIVGLVYFGIVRWFEEHKNAAVGWLLLVASKPRYNRTTPGSGV